MFETPTNLELKAHYHQLSTGVDSMRQRSRILRELDTQIRILGS